jgi:inner membrane transporter RhtA
VLAAVPRDGRRTVIALGAVLAVMNACFYLAIDRLPLATVAVIEFVGPVVLALIGARGARNLAAVALATSGVVVLTHARLAVQPLGVAFALGNAVLFCAYIVLAHRLSRQGAVSGIDGLAGAMMLALLFVCPLGIADAAHALTDPIALGAGIGVGVCSSVIPYVLDQLAMARLPRATYSLFLALLPAFATVIGVIVLGQLPSPGDIAGIVLVMVAVALHRPQPS